MNGNFLASARLPPRRPIDAGADPRRGELYIFAKPSPPSLQVGEGEAFEANINAVLVNRFAFLCMPESQ